MSRITRWFVTAGLYAVGFFLISLVLPGVVSFLRLSKTSSDVLAVVLILVIFLGVNFLVGMIQGYLKRKYISQTSASAKFISTGSVAAPIFGGIPRLYIANQEGSQLARCFVLPRGYTTDNRRFRDSGHRDSLYPVPCRDIGRIVRFPSADHIGHTRYSGAPKRAWS